MEFELACLHLDNSTRDVTTVERLGQLTDLELGSTVVG